MVHYKQADSNPELEQILVLQQHNLPKNLSKGEMASEGFLTVEHNFDLLKKMNDAFPHTIAVENGAVVGYALSMHPKFGDEIDIIQPMFEKTNQLVQGAYSYIVMGQICVAKTHRGQGIFRGLYKNMQHFTQPHFEAIITEVDAKNTRSINAHKAIGFKELQLYPADGREWSLVVLK